MSYQSTFKRYELKYLLTHEQKENILTVMSEYMRPDKYARSTVRNLYFDTPDFKIIRRSLEKPDYKEKLRLRSYATVDGNDEVFVELKKKYDKVVYKRRIALPLNDAMDWLYNRRPCAVKGQISNEINYFLGFYHPLAPTVFLSYDREAYYGICDDGFRVTFDENILCRQTDLSPTKEPGGNSILDKELSLMELKCYGGIPMWMARALSSMKLYKTPFSKYGTAYEKLIFQEIKLRKCKGKNTYDMDKLRLYLSDTLYATVDGFFSKI